MQCGDDHNLYWTFFNFVRLTASGHVLELGQRLDPQEYVVELASDKDR